LLVGTERLLRLAFGKYLVEWPGNPGIEFHLSHGDWIRLLRRSGFEVEDLIEERPAAGANLLFGAETSPFGSLDRTKLIELTADGKRYDIAGGEYRRQRDSARRRARLEKAESEVKRLAAVRRKQTNPQKLASQVGRKLRQQKAKYQYWVDEQGNLQYRKNDELIDSWQSLDGLNLLHTSLEPAQCAKEQVLGNYMNLLPVADAFCQL
jgi:hypothetical protein